MITVQRKQLKKINKEASIAPCPCNIIDGLLPSIGLTVGRRSIFSVIVIPSFVDCFSADI